MKIYILKVVVRKDWRELLKETTGEGLNTKALLDYFRQIHT